MEKLTQTDRTQRKLAVAQRDGLHFLLQSPGPNELFPVDRRLKSGLRGHAPISQDLAQLLLLSSRHD